jgi:hypothetical protein
MNDFFAEWLGIAYPILRVVSCQCVIAAAAFGKFQIHIKPKL